MNQKQINYISKIKNGFKYFYPETAKDHVMLVNAFQFFGFSAGNFRAIFPFTWYQKKDFYIVADYENQIFNIKYTGG